MNLLDYLKKRRPLLPQECMDDFLPKARRARLPVRGISVDLFTHIFHNLSLVLAGVSPKEIPGLEEHWPLFRSMQTGPKLGCVLELYLSAENRVRDCLLGSEDHELCLSERMVLFEEANGGFHALLDQEFPECCDGCLSSIRERFHEVQAMGRATGLVEKLSEYAPMAKSLSIKAPLLSEELPECDSLDTFIDQFTHELLDTWVGNMETPESSSNNVSVLEAVGHAFAFIVACGECDKTWMRNLLETFPGLGRNYALNLCSVGEESLASVLALRHTGNEREQAEMRYVINQRFHVLVRGLIHSECGRCGKALCQIRETMDGLQLPG